LEVLTQRQNLIQLRVQIRQLPLDLDHSRSLDARGHDEYGIGVHHASLGTLDDRNNLMHDYDCLPPLRILDAIPE
jgi:hypothetical protein